MTRTEQRTALVAALEDLLGPGVEDKVLAIKMWVCPVCDGGDEIYRPLAVSLNGRDPLAWCDECGVGTAALIAALAARDNRDRYHGRILDVRAMLAEPQRSIPWRCEDFAADGFLTTLTGRGKEGKTWLALALAAGVARGRTAAGIPCTKGRAVIFDAENGQPLIKSRWHAAGMTGDLAVQPVEAGGLRFTHNDDMAWFRRVIDDLTPNLVIFDSLRVLSSGSKESDGDEMEPIITALKQIARETGAAVILIHHRGKGESAYRGTSVILDQTDMMFTLGRVDGDPEAATRRKVTTVGCRVAREPAPRWVQIKGDDANGLVYVNEAEPYEADTERPRDALRQQVLGVLTGISQSGARIATTLGRNKNDGTIRRVLEDLAVDGLAERRPDGWGVASHTVPLVAGNPGNPPENGSSKPNQGLPTHLLVDTLGNPPSGGAA